MQAGKAMAPTSLSEKARKVLWNTVKRVKRLTGNVFLSLTKILGFFD